MYQPGKLVLLKNEKNTKFGTDAYQDPWKIKSINQNGTVTINKGVVDDIVNMRNIHPYRSSKD